MVVARTTVSVAWYSVAHNTISCYNPSIISTQSIHGFHQRYTTQMEMEECETFTMYYV